MRKIVGVFFRDQKEKSISTGKNSPLSQDAKRRIRKGIKMTKYMIKNDYISFKTAFSSINTYKHSYKYTNSKYIDNTLDKYWY